ncbi:acetyltransferase, partial [Xanthomonas euvesicatoria]
MRDASADLAGLTAMSVVTLPARWREQPNMRGRHASLEPLQTAHADGLREVVGDGALSRLWYTSVPAPEQVEAYIAAALA